MARPVSNTFLSFEFTAEEEITAANLSLLQMQYIQNEIAALAAQKLALVFDPEHAMKFACDSNYLQGKLDFANGLLVAAEAAAERMEQASQSADSQH